MGLANSPRLRQDDWWWHRPRLGRRAALGCCLGLWRSHRGESRTHGRTDIHGHDVASVKGLDWLYINQTRG